MDAKEAKPKDLADEIGKQRPFESAEQEAFLNLVRTYEHLSAGFARLFKEHGISEAQYNVLRILRGHGQRRRTQEVAAEMITREPDITRLVDRLVGAGLVARVRCPADRRVVWVELTPAGDELLERLDDPVLELHQRQLGHMGRGQLDQLNRLLFEARHAV